MYLAIYKTSLVYCLFKFKDNKLNLESENAAFRSGFALTLGASFL